MKKKTKGYIVAGFFGLILLTSAMAIAIPGITPPMEDEKVTITGTPADNFPDSQRPQFCGTGNAKSNEFVKEYKVPTVCSQPLAITSDSQGTIWFAQTNTGNIAKFEPSSEKFSEFKNPSWPEKGRSMMWGMDYSQDGSIWYTDENYDSVWKFSISDSKYQRLTYPSTTDSLPQRIQIVDSQIIVNDFTGNKITFLDPANIGDEISYLSLPSPVENSFTGGFTFDSKNFLWYTNWLPQRDGVLVSFDHDGYQRAVVEQKNQTLPVMEFIRIFKLPAGLTTPNGIVSDSEGNIWIADTSSSFFFKFNPTSESFSKYITSTPPPSSYGNFTGMIKSPVSRPYWMAFDDKERLVFNEQTANRIGVFDPKSESLVEYLIPSKNPTWADCMPDSDCGLAQTFDFTIVGDKIWFTEWVENNIGVVDTAKQLPFEIDLETQNLTIKKGETMSTKMTINPLKSGKLQITTSNTSDFFDLRVVPSMTSATMAPDFPVEVPITFTVSQNAISKSHKVLVGATFGEVTISKYITVNVVS